MVKRFDDKNTDINHVVSLIIAIFWRAMQDLDSSSMQIRQEAFEWLFVPNPDFDFYCGLLNVKPVELRENIKEKIYG